MKVSKENLKALVVLYVETVAAETGVIPEMQLRMGSKINGVSFRLYHVETDENGREKLTPAWGTSEGLWSEGFIGWTKREAYDTLLTIIRTMQKLHEVQGGKS